MRITLVAANGFIHDRRARALDWSLRAAGHDVTVVAAGNRDVAGPGIVRVPSRRPDGAGSLRARLREAQSPALRQRLLDAGMTRATAASRPTLVVPTTGAAVDVAVAAARRTGAGVGVDPRLTVPADVWATARAPEEPGLAAAVAGGLDHHVPGYRPAVAAPVAGRHAGRRVLLVYRQREASPGRYLHRALERAGVEVLVAEDRFDTTALPGDLDGIVVVESPYPAVEVVGPPAACPVVFWVHHGEHHLETNVRLARRYGVDHVLLAHSWHLAHRFASPVTRFPFGLPLGTIAGDRPWAQRAHDVAMVGAHLDGGGPYRRRGELVARSRAHLGEDRCAFLQGITPQEMGRVYGDSRIVLNEGGVRHHPITMRVFEAVAAGALLLTEDAPGVDLLLDDLTHLVEPFEAQLDALLADGRNGDRAAATLAAATVRHTYDHRVDELLAVLHATVPAGERVPVDGHPTLAALVDGDAEVQRLAQVGADELAEAHPDREVWPAEELGDRLVPDAMEAVAVRADDVTPLREVLRAARRYIYVAGTAAGLEAYLADEQPQAVVTVRGDVRRVDLRAPGYVV